MFHIALTPNENPANALSATSETLMGAIADLLNSISLVSGSEEWFVSRVLEATKEAVDNLENDEPAKGVWSDFSSPDDAFSIDIFCADDARYVRLDGNDLLVPHGAVGLVAEQHTTRWLYDESEISQWDNVRLPHEAVESVVNPVMSMLRHHVSGAIARGEAEAIVGQPVIPTITEVIRDIKHGDCTLSAIFSDGSERKLFNFFIDELSFSDSELIGKTETEAQALHSQKDLAYLRS